jgi:hypothetical protein
MWLRLADVDDVSTCTYSKLRELSARESERVTQSTTLQFQLKLK